MIKAVCHFSCGSTSAIATKMALEKYGPNNVEIIYADPGAEHPDNQRFLKDCEEKLFKKEVTILKSKKYETIFDVFKERRYLSGIAGAPCTLEMKKLPIREYLGARLYDEVQVFGFDAGEKERIGRFKENNPDLTVDLPLAENGITKKRALARLQQVGIELPEMYKLGFPNANCMGCVKAQNNLGYWRLVKKHFPENFEFYAKFEREIGAIQEDGEPKGATINRRTVNGVRERVFLDNLPEEYDDTDQQLDFFCGYTCG